MSFSIEREPRLPLLVQVDTSPTLIDCWSVNLSRSGLGLMATGTADYPSPAEGSTIEAEFRLPDNGLSVHLYGSVAWRHETALLRDRRTVSIGVSVTSVAEPGSRALEQYLEQYRFRVVLAFADDAEIQLTKAALGRDYDLHIATSLEDLEQLFARGDISVVIAAGADPDQAIATLEWVAMQPGRALVHGPGFADDLRPRLVCCAAIPSAAMVRFFNEGRIFRAVPRPLDADLLHRAVLAGCQDYGVRTEHHRVGLALERALRRERSRARPHLRPLALDSERLVCASQAMQQVVRLAETAAPFATSVLLTGETGVGKEVVSRLIHELSGRANADFIVQDCGTLTETLLESELFGHVRGAFTGAIQDRDGLFVAADGGTVLLDEVENTSPSLQAKLLRVIDTGEIRPVGSTTTRAVDVRIIAASNRDLQAEVEQGRFRADLYYRLSMFPIHIPPLRERRADILPLARRFLRDACTSFEFPPLTLAAAASRLLEAHTWPGNARELRNVVERAVLVSGTEALLIDAKALPAALLSMHARRLAREKVQDGSLKELVAAFEAEVIREALASNAGSVRNTAAALRADEATLWRRVKRYGLK